MGKKRREVDISFVIPTYKRLETLGKAIHSIVDQDFDLKLEVIVVDNEYFNLEESCKKNILEEFSPDIVSYYQNTTNIGIFGNWNRCIELANAEWIAMLHDDDEISEKYFYELSKFWKYIKNRKDIMYIKAKSVKTHKFIRTYKSISEYKLKDVELLGPNYIGVLGAPTCGTLINKSIFMQLGGYNEENYPAEDAMFILRQLQNKKYRIYRTNKNMGKIKHDDSVSFKQDTLIKYAEQYKILMEEYASWGKISFWMERYLRNGMYYAEKIQIMKSVLICERNEKKRFEKEIDYILGNPKKNYEYYLYLLIKNISSFVNFFV